MQCYFMICNFFVTECFVFLAIFKMLNVFYSFLKVSCLKAQNNFLLHNACISTTYLIPVCTSKLFKSYLSGVLVYSQMKSIGLIMDAQYYFCINKNNEIIGNKLILLIFQKNSHSNKLYSIKQNFLSFPLAIKK